MSIISNFQHYTPRFKLPQEQFQTLLHELLMQTNPGTDVNWLELIKKYTVSPEKIKQRYLEFMDAPFAEKPLHVRMQQYEKTVAKIFKDFYSDNKKIPDDIIHVSCTGYLSPSPPQKFISEIGWPTAVTHAYHMGCAGAFPALRMASGFLATKNFYADKTQIDIVHTELVSLHSGAPSATDVLETLVIQSLFGDGVIKYSLHADAENLTTSGMRILSFYEKVLPNSLDEMTWHLFSDRFRMTLTNKIPMLIANVVKSFSQKLCEIAGVSLENEKDNIIFAIHPGGPKIIELVQTELNLSDQQLKFSYEILRDFGNMSSATLPHIWQRILNDNEIKPHTKIISLGFGPGLTAYGMLTEVQHC
jgi:predicted naringenin-chalcone synthase